jgi:hypothetical protein
LSEVQSVCAHCEDSCGVAEGLGKISAVCQPVNSNIDLNAFEAMGNGPSSLHQAALEGEIDRVRLEIQSNPNSIDATEPT